MFYNAVVKLVYVGDMTLRESARGQPPASRPEPMPAHGYRHKTEPEYIPSSCYGPKLDFIHYINLDDLHID